MRSVIYRILGNELPPRDEPGSRIKALKFILENEPEFPDCHKLWLINHVYDEELKQAYDKELKLHGHFSFTLHHSRSLGMRDFRKAQDHWEKVRLAININKARNFAIDHRMADFTFLLDGDCFFTPTQWKAAIQQIEEDQIQNPNRQYYGVPHIRLIGTTIPESYDHLPHREPMICFRKDATMRFDESIPFSKNDKVEFLRRLGYICEKGESRLTGDLCKHVSSLFHISFSDEEVEQDNALRMKVRDESLTRLVSKLSALPLL